MVSDPAVPAYTVGNLQEGDLTDDCPVFEVHYDGLNITEVKKLLDVADNLGKMKTELAELNGKSETKLSFVVGFDTIETNSIKRKSNLVEISIKALKNAVLQSSGSLGTVPEGFRPTHEVIAPAVGWTASGVPCSVSISIGTDGVVGFRQSGSATRWLIFHTSYFI